MSDIVDQLRGRNFGKGALEERAAAEIMALRKKLARTSKQATVLRASKRLVPDARQDALEEAATIARSYVEGLGPASGWSDDEKEGYVNGVADCSAAIEAAIRCAKRDLPT